MSAQNSDHGLQRHRQRCSRHARRWLPPALTCQTSLLRPAAALPARRARARRTAARQWQAQVTLPLILTTENRERAINDLRRAVA
jgi:hypothetical protein